MTPPKPGGQLVSSSLVTAYGGPVRGGARSLAWLAKVQRELDRQHPGARLVVIQSAFNRGVDASAGTHDEDCCYDVKIIGLSWRDGEYFLRCLGAAAFYRHEPEFDLEHIHLAILPEGLRSSRPTESEVRRAYAAMGIRVGVYVPGQIFDYCRDGLGLKGEHAGQANDPARHPAHILATVFNFAADFQETHMSIRAELRALSKKHDKSLAYLAKLAVNEEQKLPHGPLRTALLGSAARLLERVKQ